MAAQFDVHRCLVLEGRSLFALSGAITDGMPRTGMRASIQDDDAFDATVHGVEILDPDDDGPLNSEPALLFHYSRREKLERWRRIDWTGKRVRLSW